MANQKSMHDTINQFMNKTLISSKMINGVTKYYRMCELELYLTDATHPDPFTHGDEHQILVFSSQRCIL